MTQVLKPLGHFCQCGLDIRVNFHIAPPSLGAEADTKLSAFYLGLRTQCRWGMRRHKTAAQMSVDRKHFGDRSAVPHTSYERTLYRAGKY